MALFSLSSVHPPGHPGPSPSVRQVVKHRYFDRLLLSLIIINTIILASDYHDMPQLHTDINEYINTVLTILFTVEMVLKLIGLGVYHYFEDKWNAFDCLIVVTSLFEMAVT